MTWDFMGSNGNLWAQMARSCLTKGQNAAFCGLTASSPAIPRPHGPVSPPYMVRPTPHRIFPHHPKKKLRPAGFHPNSWQADPERLAKHRARADGIPGKAAVSHDFPCGLIRVAGGAACPFPCFPRPQPPRPRATPPQRMVTGPRAGARLGWRNGGAATWRGPQNGQGRPDHPDGPFSVVWPVTAAGQAMPPATSRWASRA